MTMGMSIELWLLEPQLSSYRFVRVYSRFLHTTTAPAVTAIITTSRTISAQLIVDLLYEHYQNLSATVR
jgi:hypothetical protein